jgi:hypothetical protein
LPKLETKLFICHKTKIQVGYGTIFFFYNSMTYVAIEFFSLDELREGSKALHDVLELDLPKMQKAKPEHVSPTSSHICDRCGRDLYASPDKDV